MPVILKDSFILVEEKLYTGLVLDKTPTEFLLAVSDAKAPLVPTKRSKSKNHLNRVCNTVINQMTSIGWVGKDKKPDDGVFCTPSDLKRGDGGM